MAIALDLIRKSLFLLCFLMTFVVTARAENTRLQADPGDLRISEIMYHPLDEASLDGDSLEYIEIRNTGSTSVDLNGVAFTNGISYTFGAGTSLAAGAYLVLAANAGEFANHYGFTPFGDYDGRLDNAGEQITLSDASGTTIQSFRYGDRHPWPVGPDGVGFSLVPTTESSAADYSDPSSWRPGPWGGSPGGVVVLSALSAPIEVNEVLSHTDLPFKDAVELFNPTGATVDISGWYLTDVKEEPRKFKMPANTTIASMGYLVFDEDDFNAVPGVPPSFALSSFGDGIYLFSANAQDELTGYVRGFDFGGAANGVTFGREVWASGEEELLPQISETLGRANSGARIGPVVISELMYGPVPGEEEFLELVNISSQTVALFDQQFPENVWQIEGIGFSFPQNTELGPNSIALVVPVAPDEFRTARGVPASVQIFGPYAGRLNNAGERIQLQAPEDPDLDGTVPYFNIDAVRYEDNTPWPVRADGGGFSLVKINLDGLSNDPANWQTREAGGSPGFVDLGSVSSDRPTDLPSELTATPIYPNPMDQEAQFVLTTDVSGKVQVKLYDVLGRVAKTMFDGEVSTGEKREIMLQRDGLAAGTYYLVMENKKSRISRPVVIR